MAWPTSLFLWPHNVSSPVAPTTQQPPCPPPLVYTRPGRPSPRRRSPTPNPPPLPSWFQTSRERERKGGPSGKFGHKKTPGGCVRSLLSRLLSQPEKKKKQSVIPYLVAGGLASCPILGMERQLTCGPGLSILLYICGGLLNVCCLTELAGTRGDNPFLLPRKHSPDTSCPRWLECSLEPNQCKKRLKLQKMIKKMSTSHKLTFLKN